MTIRSNKSVYKTLTIQGIGIVESHLVSGSYGSGGGRCDTDQTDVHCIQFGPHTASCELQDQYRATRSHRTRETDVSFVMNVRPCV
jgi:hypothetical protein